MMKPRILAPRLAIGTAVFLALALPTAAQDLLWRGFDTDIGGFGCGDWGVAHTTIHEASLDASGNAASGSLLVTGEFAAPGELTLQVCSGLADLSPYKSVALDVFVPESATPDSDGSFGSLRLRLRPGWAWPGDVIDLGKIDTKGWTRIEKPLPATATAFAGLNIHWTASRSTPSTIALDNLTFLAKDTVEIWRGFDTDVGGFNCGNWGVAHTVAFDPAIDAQGNAASGSLAVEAQFATGGEVTLQACSGRTDVAKYDKIAFDVYVDAAATPDSEGSYGTFSVRLRPEWAWPGDLIELGKVTKTGWTRLEKEIPASATKFAGLNIHWRTTHTSPAKIWIDNLAFITTGAPPPAPAVSLARTVPGLEVVTSGSGDYSRKNIATVADLAPQLSWVNAGGPVKYSMTINESVGPESAGFSANLMIIGTENTSISAFPDWSEANGIFLEAIPNAQGRVAVSARYKVNAANGHGDRFQPAGLLAEVTNTGLNSLVGTWSLVLNGATVTIEGPGGITASGTLPNEVLEKFSQNVFALFGAQPNTRKDRRISLASVGITGPASFTAGFTEDFTKAQALNPARLEPKEEDGGGVRLKPNDAVYRISWPLPDAGFELRRSGTVLPGNWTAAGLPAVQQGAYRTVYIPASTATGDVQFFRLAK